MLNFTYTYQLHNLQPEGSLKGDFTNGWSVNGLTVLQSGQPFSIIDYSGAVGSVYYSTFDGINNPIVPLAPGCTPKNAVTGASGAWGTPALKAECFTIPLLNPGDLNGAIPANDPYETTFIANGQRNIFRQAPQKRADISLSKSRPSVIGIKLRYTLDVFNLTNTTSFDVTGDNVTQNMDYNNYPTAGTACDAHRLRATRNQRLLQLPRRPGFHAAHHRQPAPGSDVAAAGFLNAGPISGSQRASVDCGRPFCSARYIFRYSGAIAMDYID